MDDIEIIFWKRKIQSVTHVKAGVAVPSFPGSLNGQIHLRWFNVNSMEFAGSYRVCQANGDTSRPTTNIQ